MCAALMPESGMKGTGGRSDKAISDIVGMKPQRVEVALTLPLATAGARATITLEWTREDTNMPLSELLKRIETYVAEYGTV